MEPLFLKAAVSSLLSHSMQNLPEQLLISTAVYSHANTGCKCQIFQTNTVLKLKHVLCFLLNNRGLCRISFV